MTTTTAAARALADGEHLVHRPRGVVHLYRGPLTASGRFAKRGPACGQRTNRLTVLEPPQGMDDPVWSRRLCQRCEQLLAPAPARVSRDDWDDLAALTLPQLAVDLRMAESLDEVDRIAFVALRHHRYADLIAPLRGRDSALSLAERIGKARFAFDTALQDRDRAITARLQDAQERSKVARAREDATEAQRLADTTGNPVDRLRATRARERADRVAGRAPSVPVRNPVVVKGGPSCSRSA